MKIKKLKISLSFIPSQVVFLIGKKNHNNYIDKLGMDKEWYMNNDGLTTEIWNDKKGHVILISVTDEPFDVYEIKGLIVHEISHAVDFITRKHGIVDDETRAYMAQHLYIEIIKYYDRQIAKK